MTSENLVIRMLLNLAVGSLLLAFLRFRNSLPSRESLPNPIEFLAGHRYTPRFCELGIVWARTYGSFVCEEPAEFPVLAGFDSNSQRQHRLMAVALTSTSS